MKQTETEVQSAILAYLRLRGHLPIRIKTQGVPLWSGKTLKRFRPAPQRGVADIIVFLKGGRAAAIECKRPGGKPSPEQVDFLEQVKSTGNIAIIATSIEDVQQAGLSGCLLLNFRTPRWQRSDLLATPTNVLDDGDVKFSQVRED